MISTLNELLTPTPTYAHTLSSPAQAQFFIMLGFAVTGFVIDCDYPRWMAYALAAYMLSLIVLFMNFYRHAYNKSQEEKKKKKAQ